MAPRADVRTATDATTTVGPRTPHECLVQKCVAFLCVLDTAPPGTPCKGGMDQCNAVGLCVDCIDSAGCEDCCNCEGNMCVPT